MLNDDIKRLNDHHANLKHYNKNVAESWYRIRDLMERIKDAFESKLKSDNNERDVICPSCGSRNIYSVDGNSDFLQCADCKRAWVDRHTPVS